MGLEERITTSFQRIARGRSLVRAQSLSAAPRAKKWARNQKILIFLAAEFFRKIIEKSWCHRAGAVLKYTPDTVSRSRHCSFRKIYALKTPNRKVWCVRRHIRRMSNFCRHIQWHIQWNGLRVEAKMLEPNSRDQSIFWSFWPNFEYRSEFIDSNGPDNQVGTKFWPCWNSKLEIYPKYP